jgi:hypothetical protein
MALHQQKESPSGLAVEKLSDIGDAQSLSPDGKKMAIIDYSVGMNIAVVSWLPTKGQTLVTHLIIPRL